MDPNRKYPLSPDAYETRTPLRTTPMVPPPLAGSKPLAGGTALAGSRALAVPVARPISRPGSLPPPPPTPGVTPPRPPSRAGNAYRGLPEAVKIIGWVLIALAVGLVIGATAPTAFTRIAAVLAVQPGLLAWYCVRGLGFLAYLVLAGSVLYGLLLSTKILDAIAHRPVSFALHKDLAIVALILAGLHGSLLIFDASFPFTARAILVPFASPYSPITVGVGQLTFYGSVAVTASFYVRRHIGQKAWRMLHYVTFLTFAGASFHGIASGSDSGAAWAFWIYLVPVTAAIFLITYRVVVGLAHLTHRPSGERTGVDGAQLLRPRGPLDRPGATPGGSLWPS